MRKPLLILIAIAAVFILAACASTADPTTACPSPTTDTKLLVNEEHGYCLLYPSDRSVDYPPMEHCLITSVDPQGCQFITLPGTDSFPGASISVENASGRTPSEVADAEIAALGPDFNITRSELTVGGEPAILMDGLPGQDLVRKLVIVHGALLYTLSFTPWASGDTELVEFYDTIVNSLHFLPPHLRPLATHTPLPEGFQFSFEYPVDGQVLDFEGAYLFKVTDIVGAGYQWTFSQNGVVVWDNVRDNFGLDGGGTYAILEGSPAHARFIPGKLTVSVRALMVGDYYSDTTVITIILQPIQITPAP